MEFNTVWREDLVRSHSSKIWVSVLERPHEHKR